MKIKNIWKIALSVPVALLALVIGAMLWGKPVPQRVDFGTVAEPAGSWTLETGKLRFAAALPADSEQVLLLQTHWPDYSVHVDENQIFSIQGERLGNSHLIALPEGKTLNICFDGADESRVSSIRQASIQLGSKSGVYKKLVTENLYAVLFAFLSLFLTAASQYAGFRMRAKQDVSRGVMSLGTYILLAGIWVLTDSQILLLVTRRTDFVEFISFLAFYSMPLPLLSFSRKMLTEKGTAIAALQALFGVTLVLFLANCIFNVMPSGPLIIMEHLLMGLTIGVMLVLGLWKLKQQRNRKLSRIVAGYAVFSLCSMFALLHFYLQQSVGYSMSYVLGIMGFIYFLVDATWIEICEQIQESANVSLYAKLAFSDQMTGLRNRTAYMEEEKRLHRRQGTLGYIMVDVNNLKKINDAFGHQAGDELIIQVADCLRRAVGNAGNCYRIGGDEFVVVLQRVAWERVAQLAEKIRREVQQADEKHKLTISASLGWAWSENPEENPEQIFQQADNAMYEEKRRMKAYRG